MKMGNPLSHVDDSKLHIGLSIFWLVMMIPTLLWWADSVAVVLIYSVYALMAAHFAAYEGAKNDDKIDKILELLERQQVKCYTDGMTIYELAELMHTKLCKYNHTDSCPWLYEKDAGREDMWYSQYAHMHWLAKTERIQEAAGLDPEDIAKVIKAIE